MRCSSYHAMVLDRIISPNHEHSRAIEAAELSGDYQKKEELRQEGRDAKTHAKECKVCGPKLRAYEERMFGVASIASLPTAPKPMPSA